MRVLDRRSFLAAMSSHEGARSRAHAVAAEHLAQADVQSRSSGASTLTGPER
jgi:hypothetical protein